MLKFGRINYGYAIIFANGGQNNVATVGMA